MRIGTLVLLGIGAYYAYCYYVRRPQLVATGVAPTLLPPPGYGYTTDGAGNTYQLPVPPGTTTDNKGNIVPLNVGF